MHFLIAVVEAINLEGESLASDNNSIVEIWCKLCLRLLLPNLKTEAQHPIHECKWTGQHSLETTLEEAPLLTMKSTCTMQPARVHQPNSSFTTFKRKTQLVHSPQEQHTSNIEATISIVLVLGPTLHESQQLLIQTRLQAPLPQQ